MNAPRRRPQAARSRARRLAMQALYQWQLNPQPSDTLLQEFDDNPERTGTDLPYFEALVCGVIDQRSRLDAHLRPCLDRPEVQLDPVERALLWIATYELDHMQNVPWRVAVNEAVELAKGFGAEQGHRYVNGVLDKVARHLRSDIE